MEPAKDAGPPPVDGLGNYKGVMLCNRPVEDNGLKMRSADDGNLPFKSMIHPQEREQIGLQPCKQVEPRTAAVKTRGPSAALRRHTQWIKELQVQVADETGRIADDEDQQENKKQRMQVLFKQQRDAIKDLKKAGLNTLDDVKQLESHLKSTCGVKGAKSRTGGKKPLWAMTEEEQEGAEDAEAAALIDFAENLDFDKYVDDSEFKNCLQAVNNRAKKLQREQDKFKDDLIRDFNAENPEDDEEYGSAYTGGSPRDSQLGSQLGDPGRTGPARRRPGEDERPDWDGSTAMGDDAPGRSQDGRSEVDRVMEAMPQLKGIHSKESVQRMIEKARVGTPSRKTDFVDLRLVDSAAA